MTANIGAIGDEDLLLPLEYDTAVRHNVHPSVSRRVSRSFFEWSADFLFVEDSEFPSSPREEPEKDGLARMRLRSSSGAREGVNGGEGRVTALMKLPTEGYIPVVRSKVAGWDLLKFGGIHSLPIAHTLARCPSHGPLPSDSRVAHKRALSGHRICTSFEVRLELAALVSEEGL